MSTIKTVEKECALCGNKEMRRVLMSSNSCGYCDLDGRPAEMHRSTMPYWVQSCSKCGYVNRYIDRQADLEMRKLRKLVKSKSYITCDGILLPGHVAEMFYRFYLMSDIIDDPSECFFGLRCCAWCCDDAGEMFRESARLLRKKAIIYLLFEIAFGAISDKEQNSRMIILSDYYRMVGKFEKAIEILNELLQRLDDELLIKIARYELYLSTNKDSRLDSVASAVRFAEEK